jgi:putative peptidoglycan lipid II flippase
MALLKSIATVGGYTMISRVLGFLRDILIAAVLGAGPIADAFFVAFKLPNFFRRLFAEGAFNAAFVPLFSARLEGDGFEPARRFAAEVLAVMAAGLFVFVTALQIAMPWVMLAMAPGFIGEPAKFDLAVQLARITFPYLLFISLVSHLGGVLNSLGRFAAAAATPIILNLALIAALLLAAPFLPTPGHALAWGVAAGGIAQFLWLIEACRRAGMRFPLPPPKLTADVKRLLRLMLPGAVGAGVVQINLMVGVVIASLLPTGAVSFLYYADRVNQLPLGVVGVAVGTALLPLLSRQLRAGEDAAASGSMNRALEFSLLLTVPGAAALVVIAGPVTATLFERGAFGAAETAATAAALAAYATGLPAYVLVKVLAPGFFARHDTATPVKIAVVAVIVNVVLNLILMWPLAHVGIALATSIAAWLNAALLAIVLRRRGQLAFDARLLRAAPRQGLAAAGMAAALWAGEMALGPMLAAGSAGRAAALTALVASGMAVYFGLAIACGAVGRDDLKRLLLRRRAPAAP